VRGHRETTSIADFLEWKERARSFQYLGPISCATDVDRWASHVGRRSLPRARFHARGGSAG
jgi:hypothetical protein